MEILIYVSLWHLVNESIWSICESVGAVIRQVIVKWSAVFHPHHEAAEVLSETSDPRQHETDPKKMKKTTFHINVSHWILTWTQTLHARLWPSHNKRLSKMWYFDVIRESVNRLIKCNFTELCATTRHSSSSSRLFVNVSSTTNTFNSVDTNIIMTL